MNLHISLFTADNFIRVATPTHTPHMHIAVCTHMNISIPMHACVYACTHSKTWENLHLKYVEMLLYTIDFLVSGDGLVFDSSSGYIIQNNKTYFVTRQKLVFEKNQKPRSNLSEIRGKKIIFLLTLMKHFFFLGRMKLTLKIWSAP